ncbi:glycerophosphodiester phosphodiesterase family protein [Paraurantiacibacter namhicola]|nr:glycerophosphodiester phosphodiesterase family protein [Paraurantiacibacter namhicola]
MAQEETAMADADMIVIAHRGASAERPEHTLEAYALAIDQGADYIEPDLVVTKDGVLVARHENELSDTTDVATRPEFGGRRTTKVIDGEEVTGWFAEDFTLAELETLRVRERLPELRPGNTAYDYLYRIPSLGEIIALVSAKEAETGRRIGLYPELKHPAHLETLGFDPAQMLVDELAGSGYGAGDPVFVQSFEVVPLVRVKQGSAFRTIQLMSLEGGPADAPANVTYAKMMTPEGLAQVARYADGIGVPIAAVLTADGGSTGLVGAAHEAGLLVHVWTLRPENAFLPEGLQSGEGPAEHGCDDVLFYALVRVGVDGVFADSPARTVPLKGGNGGRCARAWLPATPLSPGD